MLCDCEVYHLGGGRVADVRGAERPSWAERPSEAERPSGAGRRDLGFVAVAGVVAVMVGDVAKMFRRKLDSRSEFEDEDGAKKKTEERRKVVQTTE